MATRRQHSKLQVLETRSTSVMTSVAQRFSEVEKRHVTSHRHVAKKAANRSQRTRRKCKHGENNGCADTKEGRLMASDIKNAGNVTRNGGRVQSDGQEIAQSAHFMHQRRSQDLRMQPWAIWIVGCARCVDGRAPRRSVRCNLCRRSRTLLKDFAERSTDDKSEAHRGVCRQDQESLRLSRRWRWVRCGIQIPEDPLPPESWVRDKIAP